jgi:hypothetical protein
MLPTLFTGTRHLPNTITKPEPWSRKEALPEPGPLPYYCGVQCLFPRKRLLPRSKADRLNKSYR